MLAAPTGSSCLCPRAQRAPGHLHLAQKHTRGSAERVTHVPVAPTHRSCPAFTHAPGGSVGPSTPLARAECCCCSLVYPTSHVCLPRPHTGELSQRCCQNTLCPRRLHHVTQVRLSSCANAHECAARRSCASRCGPAAASRHAHTFTLLPEQRGGPLRICTLGWLHTNHWPLRLQPAPKPLKTQPWRRRAGRRTLFRDMP